MKKHLALTALIAMLLPLIGCSPKGGAQKAQVAAVYPGATIGSAAVNPKASIFRMNGDYADKVAVTLNKEGNLQYYPAPTDISEDSAPYSLGDGWYLNRQGLATNSVFTKWTFDEYRALPKTPSPEEIKAAIIPGSGVTEMQQLPVSISEALSDPAACIKYIPTGK